ncbi:unnamed protein product [Amoebophrya sp. A120]|nr:unnamed protein product [Amoebophrya sp. A120]|eukprot:GSA120T00014292001.1
MVQDQDKYNLGSDWVLPLPATEQDFEKQFQRLLYEGEIQAGIRDHEGRELVLRFDEDGKVVKRLKSEVKEEERNEHREYFQRKIFPKEERDQKKAKKEAWLNSNGGDLPLWPDSDDEGERKRQSSDNESDRKNRNPSSESDSGGSGGEGKPHRNKNRRLLDWMQKEKREKAANCESRLKRERRMEREKKLKKLQEKEKRRIKEERDVKRKYHKENALTYRKLAELKEEGLVAYTEEEKNARKMKKRAEFEEARLKRKERILYDETGKKIMGRRKREEWVEMRALFEEIKAQKRRRFVEEKNAPYRAILQQDLKPLALNAFAINELESTAICDQDTRTFPYNKQDLGKQAMLNYAVTARSEYLMGYCPRIDWEKIHALLYNYSINLNAIGNGKFFALQSNYDFMLMTNIFTDSRIKNDAGVLQQHPQNNKKLPLRGGLMQLENRFLPRLFNQKSGLTVEQGKLIDWRLRGTASGMTGYKQILDRSDDPHQLLPLQDREDVMRQYQVLSGNDENEFSFQQQSLLALEDKEQSVLNESMMSRRSTQSNANQKNSAGAKTKRNEDVVGSTSTRKKSQSKNDEDVDMLEGNGVTDHDQSGLQEQAGSFSLDENKGRATSKYDDVQLNFDSFRTVAKNKESNKNLVSGRSAAEDKKFVLVTGPNTSGNSFAEDQRCGGLEDPHGLNNSSFLTNDYLNTSGMTAAAREDLSTSRRHPALLQHPDGSALLTTEDILARTSPAHCDKAWVKADETAYLKEMGYKFLEQSDALRAQKPMAISSDAWEQQVTEVNAMDTRDEFGRSQQANSLRKQHETSVALVEQPVEILMNKETHQFEDEDPSETYAMKNLPNSHPHCPEPYENRTLAELEQTPNFQPIPELTNSKYDVPIHYDRYEADTLVRLQTCGATPYGLNNIQQEFYRYDLCLNEGKFPSVDEFTKQVLIEFYSRMGVYRKKVILQQGDEFVKSVDAANARDLEIEENDPDGLVEIDKWRADMTQKLVAKNGLTGAGAAGVTPYSEMEYWENMVRHLEKDDVLADPVESVMEYLDLFKSSLWKNSETREKAPWKIRAPQQDEILKNKSGTSTGAGAGGSSKKKAAVDEKKSAIKGGNKSTSKAVAVAAQTSKSKSSSIKVKKELDLDLDLDASMMSSDGGGTGAASEQDQPPKKIRVKKELGMESEDEDNVDINRSQSKIKQEQHDQQAGGETSNIFDTNSEAAAATVVVDPSYEHCEALLSRTLAKMALPVDLLFELHEKVRAKYTFRTSTGGGSEVRKNDKEEPSSSAARKNNCGDSCTTTSEKEPEFPEWQKNLGEFFLKIIRKTGPKYFDKFNPIKKMEKQFCSKNTLLPGNNKDPILQQAERKQKLTFMELPSSLQDKETWRLDHMPEKMYVRIGTFWRPIYKIPKRWLYDVDVADDPFNDPEFDHMGANEWTNEDDDAHPLENGFNNGEGGSLLQLENVANGHSSADHKKPLLQQGSKKKVKKEQQETLLPLENDTSVGDALSKTSTKMNKKKSSKQKPTVTFADEEDDDDKAPPMMMGGNGKNKNLSAMKKLQVVSAIQAVGGMKQVGGVHQQTKQEQEFSRDHDSEQRHLFHSTPLVKQELQQDESSVLDQSMMSTHSRMSTRSNMTNTSTLTAAQRQLVAAREFYPNMEYCLDETDHQTFYDDSDLSFQAFPALKQEEVYDTALPRGDFRTARFFLNSQCKLSDEQLQIYERKYLLPKLKDSEEALKKMKATEDAWWASQIKKHPERAPFVPEWSKKEALMDVGDEKQFCTSILPPPTVFTTQVLEDDPEIADFDDEDCFTFDERCVDPREHPHLMYDLLPTGSGGTGLRSDNSMVTSGKALSTVSRNFLNQDQERLQCMDSHNEIPTVQLKKLKINQTPANGGCSNLNYKLLSHKKRQQIVHTDANNRAGNLFNVENTADPYNKHIFNAQNHAGQQALALLPEGGKSFQALEGVEWARKINLVADEEKQRKTDEYWNDPENHDQDWMLPWQEQAMDEAPGAGELSTVPCYEGFIKNHNEGRLIGYSMRDQAFADYGRKVTNKIGLHDPLAYIVAMDNTRIDNPALQLRVSNHAKAAQYALDLYNGELQTINDYAWVISLEFDENTDPSQPAPPPPEKERYPYGGNDYHKFEREQEDKKLYDECQNDKDLKDLRLIEIPGLKTGLLPKIYKDNKQDLVDVVLATLDTEHHGDHTTKVYGPRVMDPKYKQPILPFTKFEQEAVDAVKAERDLATDKQIRGLLDLSDLMIPWYLERKEKQAEALKKEYEETVTNEYVEKLNSLKQHKKEQMNIYIKKLRRMFELLGTVVPEAGMKHFAAALEHSDEKCGFLIEQFGREVYENLKTQEKNFLVKENEKLERKAAGNYKMSAVEGGEKENSKTIYEQGTFKNVNGVSENFSNTGTPLEQLQEALYSLQDYEWSQNLTKLIPDFYEDKTSATAADDVVLDPTSVARRPAFSTEESLSNLDLQVGKLVQMQMEKLKAKLTVEKVEPGGPVEEQYSDTMFPSVFKKEQDDEDSVADHEDGENVASQQNSMLHLLGGNHVWNTLLMTDDAKKNLGTVQRTINKLREMLWTKAFLPNPEDQKFCHSEQCHEQYKEFEIRKQLLVNSEQGCSMYQKLNEDNTTKIAYPNGYQPMYEKHIVDAEQERKEMKQALKDKLLNLYPPHIVEKAFRNFDKLEAVHSDRLQQPVMGEIESWSEQHGQGEKDKPYALEDQEWVVEKVLVEQGKYQNLLKRREIETHLPDKKITSEEGDVKMLTDHVDQKTKRKSSGKKEKFEKYMLKENSVDGFIIQQLREEHNAPESMKTCSAGGRSCSAGTATAVLGGTKEDVPADVFETSSDSGSCSSGNFSGSGDELSSGDEKQNNQMDQQKQQLTPRSKTLARREQNGLVNISHLDAFADSGYMRKLKCGAEEGGNEMNAPALSDDKAGEGTRIDDVAIPMDVDSEDVVSASTGGVLVSSSTTKTTDAGKTWMQKPATTTALVPVVSSRSHQSSGGAVVLSSTTSSTTDEASTQLVPIVDSNLGFGSVHPDKKNRQLTLAQTNIDVFGKNNENYTTEEQQAVCLKQIESDKDLYLFEKYKYLNLKEKVMQKALTEPLKPVQPRRHEIERRLFEDFERECQYLKETEEMSEYSWEGKESEDPDTDEEYKRWEEEDLTEDLLKKVDTIVMADVPEPVPELRGRQDGQRQQTYSNEEKATRFREYLGMVEKENLIQAKRVREFLRQQYNNEQLAFMNHENDFDSNNPFKKMKADVAHAQNLSKITGENEIWENFQRQMLTATCDGDPSTVLDEALPDHEKFAALRHASYCFNICVWLQIELLKIEQIGSEHNFFVEKQRENEKEQDIENVLFEKNVREEEKIAEYNAAKWKCLIYEHMTAEERAEEEQKREELYKKWTQLTDNTKAMLPFLDYKRPAEKYQHALEDCVKNQDRYMEEADFSIADKKEEPERVYQSIMAKHKKNWQNNIDMTGMIEYSSEEDSDKEQVGRWREEPKGYSDNSSSLSFDSSEIETDFSSDDDAAAAAGHHHNSENFKKLKEFQKAVGKKLHFQEDDKDNLMNKQLKNKKKRREHLKLCGGYAKKQERVAKLKKEHQKRGTKPPPKKEKGGDNDDGLSEEEGKVAPAVAVSAKGLKKAPKKNGKLKLNEDDDMFDGEFLDRDDGDSTSNAKPKKKPAAKKKTKNDTPLQSSMSDEDDEDGDKSSKKPKAKQKMRKMVQSSPDGSDDSLDLDLSDDNSGDEDGKNQRKKMQKKGVAKAKPNPMGANREEAPNKLAPEGAAPEKVEKRERKPPKPHRVRTEPPNSDSMVSLSFDSEPTETSSCSSGSETGTESSFAKESSLDSSELSEASVGDEWEELFRYNYPRKEINPFIIKRDLTDNFIQQSYHNGALLLPGNGCRESKDGNMLFNQRFKHRLEETHQFQRNDYDFPPGKRVLTDDANKMKRIMGIEHLVFENKEDPDPWCETFDIDKMVKRMGMAYNDLEQDMKIEFKNLVPNGSIFQPGPGEPGYNMDYLPPPDPGHPNRAVEVYDDDGQTKRDPSEPLKTSFGMGKTFLMQAVPMVKTADGWISKAHLKRGAFVECGKLVVPGETEEDEKIVINKDLMVSKWEVDKYLPVPAKDMINYDKEFAEKEREKVKEEDKQRDMVECNYDRSFVEELKREKKQIFDEKTCEHYDVNDLQIVPFEKENCSSNTMYGDEKKEGEKQDCHSIFRVSGLDIVSSDIPESKEDFLQKFDATLRKNDNDSTSTSGILLLSGERNINAGTTSTLGGSHRNKNFQQNYLPAILKEGTEKGDKMDVEEDEAASGGIMKSGSGGKTKQMNAKTLTAAGAAGAGEEEDTQAGEKNVTKAGEAPAKGKAAAKKKAGESNSTGNKLAPEPPEHDPELQALLQSIMENVEYQDKFVTVCDVTKDKLAWLEELFGKPCEKVESNTNSASKAKTRKELVVKNTTFRILQEEEVLEQESQASVLIKMEEGFSSPPSNGRTSNKMKSTTLLTIEIPLASVLKYNAEQMLKTSYCVDNYKFLFEDHGDEQAAAGASKKKNDKNAEEIGNVKDSTDEVDHPSSKVEQVFLFYFTSSGTTTASTVAEAESTISNNSTTALKTFSTTAELLTKSQFEEETEQDAENLRAERRRAKLEMKIQQQQVVGGSGTTGTATTLAALMDNKEYNVPLSVVHKMEKQRAGRLMSKNTMKCDQQELDESSSSMFADMLRRRDEKPGALSTSSIFGKNSTTKAGQQETTDHAAAVFDSDEDKSDMKKPDEIIVMKKADKNPSDAPAKSPAAKKRKLVETPASKKNKKTGEQMKNNKPTPTKQVAMKQAMKKATGAKESKQGLPPPAVKVKKERAPSEDDAEAEVEAQTAVKIKTEMMKNATSTDKRPGDATSHVQSRTQEQSKYGMINGLPLEFYVQQKLDNIEPARMAAELEFASLDPQRYIKKIQEYVDNRWEDPFLDTCHNYREENPNNDPGIHDFARYSGAQENLFQMLYKEDKMVEKFPDATETEDSQTEEEDSDERENEEDLSDEEDFIRRIVVKQREQREYERFRAEYPEKTKGLTDKELLKLMHKMDQKKRPEKDKGVVYGRNYNKELPTAEEKCKHDFLALMNSHGNSRHCRRAYKLAAKNPLLGLPMRKRLLPDFEKNKMGNLFKTT